MAVATPPVAAGGERVVLQGVSWELYERLGRELEGQHVFLTYDEGRLEIMTTSPEHEWWKTTAARLLELVALEWDVAVEGLGSTTFTREDLAKGLEPDECYYLRDIRQLARKRKADLRVDPPPDLVIEVDITHHAVDRERIYGAMGVRELWHFDGRTLTMHERQPDGRYAPIDGSLCLPGLRPSDFLRFLLMAAEESQDVAARAFRDWLRANPRGGASSPSSS
jgi:Uma2 family endonuclease